MKSSHAPTDFASIRELKSALVIPVGFPVLYRSAHITGTRICGSWFQSGRHRGSDEGRRRASMRWDSRELKAMVVPTNLKTDGIDKGYPTDKTADKPAE